MPRRLFVAITFAILTVASPLCAQVASVADDTAAPVPGAGHDYIHLLSETVNPANGTVSVTIDLPVPKSRGLTLPFALTYNSGAAGHPTGQGYVYGQGYAGWWNSLPYLTDVNQSVTYPNGVPDVGSSGETCYFATNYVFNGPDGAGHTLGLAAMSPPPFQPDGFCNAMGDGYSNFNPANYGGDSQVGATFPQPCAQNNSNGPVGPDCFNATPPLVVLDKDGTVYSFSGIATPMAWPRSIEDRNGNTINFQSSGSGSVIVTDTTGRQLVSISNPVQGGQLAPATYIVGGLSYGLTYTPVAQTIPSLVNPLPPSVPAGYQCAITNQTSNHQALQTLTLPNGRSYQFSYIPVSGPTTFGLLSKITYPDGGWVQYTWKMSDDYSEDSSYAATPLPGHTGSPITNTCNSQYKTPVVATREVGFSSSPTPVLTQSFVYHTTWKAGSLDNFWQSKQTIVTTMDNVRNMTSQTIYNYTIPVYTGQPSNVGFSDQGSFASEVAVENQVVYYDWGPSSPGKVLKTTNKTWADQFNMTQEQTVWPTSTLNTSEVDYQYGFGGFVKQKMEYYYGTGVPGALVRTTVNTPQVFAANPLFPVVASYPSTLLTLPCQTIIYSGGTSGTKMAETDYQYDGGGTCTAALAPSVSGVTGTLPKNSHDDANFGTSSTTPRGNLKSVTRQCFPHCMQGNTPYSAVTTSYTYDETGQPTSMSNPCQVGSCSDVTTAGQPTTYSYIDSWCGGDGSPAGSVNTNTYLTTLTNPLLQNATYCYGYTDGQLRESIDENSQPTTYTYGDSLNRLTLVQYPIGETIISYSDTPPNISVKTSQEIQASQMVTSVAARDGMGHITDNQLATSPACGTSHQTTTYFGTGDRKQVSNPFCTTSDPTYGLTTYAYDGVGRNTSVTHPDGTSVISTYVGRAVQVADEGNGTRNVTRISQTDSLGRLAVVCEVTSNALLGNGGTPMPSGCNQEFSSSSAFQTTYAYDALDNLTGVTQGSLNPRSFGYNSLSELVCSGNPEINPVNCPLSDSGTWVAGTVRYTYDLNGNIVSKTSPAPNQTSASKSVTTSYMHDALNRQTKLTPPSSSGEPATQVFYDSGYGGGYTVGRIVAIGKVNTTNGGWYTFRQFTYDQLGRVTLLKECTVQNCDGTSWSLTFGYDYLGDRTSWSNGFGTTFSATYNTSKQLTSVTNDTSNSNYPSPMFTASATNSYNAAGELMYDTVGNGTGAVAESRTYDGRLRPTTVTDGSQYSFNIAKYAPNGNILSVNDSVGGNWAYGTGANYSGGYDDLNRLVLAAPSGQSWSYSYAYDRYGNRWQQNLTGTGGSGPTFSTTFDANNHENTGNWTYDAAGNVTSDSGNTYVYDSQNQLQSATNLTSGTTTCYFYDSVGRRVQKTTAPTSCGYPITGGSSVYYVYDLGGHVIDEVSAPSGGTGSWTRQEIYAAGRHLATFTAASGQAYWDFADWVGTERARVNAVTGVTCETISSLPWGDNQTTSGSCVDVSPLHFTGKQSDTETSNSYFDSRYYRSRVGRFISTDDLGAQTPSNPQSFNLYSYAQNNPLADDDASGHDCVVLTRVGDNLVSVAVTAGQCGQIQGTYVPGTVTSVQSGADGVSVDIGYDPYSGGSGGVDNVNAPPPSTNTDDSYIRSVANGIKQWNPGVNAMKIYGLGAALGGAVGSGVAAAPGIRALAASAPTPYYLVVQQTIEYLGNLVANGQGALASGIVLELEQTPEGVKLLNDMAHVIYNTMMQVSGPATDEGISSFAVLQTLLDMVQQFHHE